MYNYMWTALYITFQVVYSQVDFCSPYGVRSALGYFYTYQSNSSDMLDISFNTNDTCSTAYVKIRNIDTQGQSIIVRTSQLQLNMSGPDWQYKPFVQRAQIGALIPGDQYEYTVYGSDTAFQGPFVVKLPNITQGANETKRIIFFSDMDSNPNNNNKSQYVFEWFINHTKQNRTQYDITIFNGDMAYDLESDNCQTGDYFLRNLSTFTPYWPLMVTPGNHDAGNNQKFSILKSFFYTPDKQELNTDDYYVNSYSFDLGLTHFVSYNPYWIVNKGSKNKTVSVQLKAIILASMKADLELAQKNRDNVPWIVVISHYPMYCSGYSDPTCYQNFQNLSQFEDLFNEYKVDLYVSGHQHSYERDAPTFRNKTSNYQKRNGDILQNYITNPSSPVYVVDGAGGNAYYMPDQPYNKSQYTVAQSVNPGVGVLSVINRTHLYFEQIAAKTGNIDDFFYIIKEDDSQKSSMTLWIILGVVIGVLLIGAIVGVVYHIRNKKALSPTHQTSLKENSLQVYDE